MLILNVLQGGENEKPQLQWKLSKALYDKAEDLNNLSGFESNSSGCVSCECFPHSYSHLLRKTAPNSSADLQQSTSARFFFFFFFQIYFIEHRQQHRRKIPYIEDTWKIQPGAHVFHFFRPTSHPPPLTVLWGRLSRVGEEQRKNKKERGKKQQKHIKT